MSRVVVNEIQAKVGNDISFNDAAKIDTLKGKTTAGSITVQGENNATTNLQQGLAKAWGQFDGEITTPVLESSFNSSSITDLGTGRFQTTITNAMNDALYPVHATVGNEQDDYAAQSDAQDHLAFIGSRTTTVQRLFCADHDDGTQDNPNSMNFLIFGGVA